MLILLSCASSYSRLVFAIQQFYWVLFMYKKEIVWVCHKKNSWKFWTCGFMHFPNLQEKENGVLEISLCLLPSALWGRFHLGCSWEISFLCLSISVSPQQWFFQMKKCFGFFLFTSPWFFYPWMRGWVSSWCLILLCAPTKSFFFTSKSALCLFIL